MRMRSYMRWVFFVGMLTRFLPAPWLGAALPGTGFETLPLVSQAVLSVRIPDDTFAATLPPSLNGVSGGGALELGQKITLTVTFSGTGTDQTYQWRKGSVDIVGATAVSYIINAAVAGDADTYSVTVTNPGGSSVASVAVTIKALAPPVVTSSPSSRTASVGQAVTFTAVASGSYPRTYQWAKNGVAVSGSTGETYTIAAAAIGDAGTYAVTISNSQGSASSSAASLTVNAAVPPVLYSGYPRDGSTTQGQNLTLESYTNGGSSPFTYQWYKNATAISGATGSQLVFNSIAVADAGTYKAVVTNAAGSVTSRDAIVSVTPATAVVITSQPLAVTVTQGQSASFSVSTNNFSYPGTYQWRKDGVAITGATNSGYSINSAALADAGNYTVVITNVAGSATSTAAALVVNAPTAPRITTHPATQTVDYYTYAYYSSANLSVQVSGSYPFTYVWKKDDVVISTTTASSSSSNSLTLGNSYLTPTQSGTYKVEVTNAAGTVTSNSATFTVRAAVAPTITTQPASAQIDPGYYYFGFSVSATSSGTGPLTYQWSKDGTGIPGATSSSYYISSSAKESDSGDYTVVITGVAGSATSSVAKLVVKASPPTITRQPSNQNTSVNGYAYFYVYDITGTGPFTYQWQKDGSAISGATNSSLSVYPKSTTDAGTYTLVVTNAVGSVTSNGATLTVAAAPVAPTIAAQPDNQTVTVGGTATFAVTASGSSPFSYYWYRNGNYYSETASNTLTISNVQLSAAGSYYVIVTNSAGTRQSIGAVLTVNPTPTAPTIATQPVSQILTAGSGVNFNVVANGTAPLTYQWNLNGTSIAGATNTNFTKAITAAGDAGSYSVVVTGPGGSVTSSAATLTINAVLVPAIVRQPADLSAKTGATISFSGLASGTGPITYQWQKDGANLSGATSATLTLTNIFALDAATYRLVATNPAGSTTSSAARLTVTLNAADFAGTYFGRLGSNPADRFALVVRADGTAHFLGFAASQRKGYSTFNFRLNADSTFSLEIPELAAGSQVSATSGRSAAFITVNAPAAEVAMRRLVGRLDPSGLTGFIDGTSLTISAAKSPTTGPALSSAGVYQSVALNSTSDKLTVVVDPTGQAFVFAQIGASVDASTSTLNASTGQVAATLASGSQATVAINAGSGSLSASVTSSANQTSSFAGLAETVVRTDRLANISSRPNIGANEVMIAGFVITGTASKPMLIRAIGPTLGTFGVGGALANPKLELYRGGTKIAENDDWAATINPNEVVTAAARTGAFALSSSSKDSALFSVLPPGAYTAQISGVGSTGGVALVEVYDASEAPSTVTAPRLVNISTRATVGEGDNILIAGIVVTGNSPKRVLVRGTGPALAAFGVGGTLADPVLKLFKGDTLLKQNDDWSESAVEAATISAASTGVGAFALLPGSKDACLILTLAPGNYTAQVIGKNGATGVALVEVYEVN